MNCKRIRTFVRLDISPREAFERFYAELEEELGHEPRWLRFEMTFPDGSVRRYEMGFN